MKRWKALIMMAAMGCSAQADEYVFGQGWQLPDAPVTVGGYVSSEYGVSRQSRYVDVDDLAVMAYGGEGRFDFMAEFEATDLYRKQTGDSAAETGGVHFHTERLYGDFSPDERRRLRVGKFNSDIGFWNQTPINVLRDTTSSPRLVEDFFPKLTTGLHYEERLSGEALQRISLTAQHTGDLDPGYNNYRIDRHYAAGADFGRGGNLWRLSGGYFRESDGKEAAYASAALKREGENWRLMAESLLLRRIGDPKGYHDLYVQGVWKFRSRHFGVVRAENTQSPRIGASGCSLLGGYVYRPLPNVALKAEYIAHPDEASRNEALFSFSVLF